MPTFVLQWVAAMAVVTGCAATTPRYAAARSPFPALLNNTNNFARRILAVHNHERAAVGLPPLQWNSALAAGAASYARGLALTGAFAHSTPASRAGVGENLWMGTHGAFSLEQMISAWASEKRVFDPGIFPRVSRSGNWADVGHYSQMIWPTTARVGCALAFSRGADYLVCRYTRAGNINGRRVP